MSFCNHSSEEILVACPVELWAERGRHILEDLSSQQDVPCPSLSPVDHEACRISRPFVEFPFDNPPWWLFVEVALDRSEHAVGAVSTACFEQGQQPALRGKLVIVDERNKITRSICDCLVSRPRDILLRLHAVRDSNRRVRCEVRYQSF